MATENLNPKDVLEIFRQQMAAMQESFAHALSQSNAKLDQSNAKLDQLAQENAAIRQEIEIIKAASAKTPPRVVLTPVSDDSNQPLPDEVLEFGSGSKPANPNTPPRLVRSERLPDPPVFTGKRKDLNSFLRQLKNKLRINQDRYPTEDERLSYAMSRLGGDAANLVEPYDLSTVQSLIGLLEASYGDPNRQATAQTKLLKLSQGTRTFPTYFAEFHRYAKETGWNDLALINHLLGSLNQELRVALLGKDRPSTLEDCANMINRLYNDLLLLGVQARTPRQTTTQALPTRTYPAQGGPDAMDLDTTNHRYAPKGSAEREKRLKEGRCFKCGSKNHISPVCSAPIPRSDLNTSQSRPESPVLPRRGSRSRHRRSHSRGSKASTASSRSSKERSRN
jgi:hypothetical protein